MRINVLLMIEDSESVTRCITTHLGDPEFYIQKLYFILPVVEIFLKLPQAGG